MSWETVTLLSVLATCMTAVLILRPGTMNGIEYSTKDEAKAMEAWLERLESGVAKLEEDYDSVHKLAEDAKKLLSQENLARGFRRQG